MAVTVCALLAAVIQPWAMLHNIHLLGASRKKFFLLLCCVLAYVTAYALLLLLLLLWSFAPVYLDCCRQIIPCTPPPDHTWVQPGWPGPAIC